MLDLGNCRIAIADALVNDAGLNVYTYPDAQPEYPAFVLGPFEQIAYHATLGCEGMAVQWIAELYVALGDDPASALVELENLAAAIGPVLDGIPPPWPWASLVTVRAERVRERDGRALSCDVVLNMTA